MARKSEDIATLLRVQSWAVDEERRMLGQMLSREAALLEDIAGMERQLLAEQQVAAAQPTLAGHAYAAFAAHYRDRRANIERVLDALRAEIGLQRDRLADAYREQKLLEEVRSNWQEAERVEEARIEQAEMDEIAQNLYQRG
jgi:flagellar FliJ protein